MDEQFNHSSASTIDQPEVPLLSHGDAGPEAAQTEQVVLDRHADVCLVTTARDGHAVEFLASSKSLTLASEVFAALLGPYFREGQSLAEALPGSPTRIPLPDDKPDGMRILLEVLHHRPTPKRLSFDELAGLARVVDKYRCEHIFGIASTFGLRQHLRGEGASKSLAEYLGIAIAFRNPEMYGAVMLGLALTAGRPLHSGTAARRLKGTVLEDLVPDKTCSGYPT